MASTGFWPVKSRLKDVISYAENPDKTIDKKYLDEDLRNAIEYAANSKKTDETMYVSAINCPKQRAYECMMATKKRFGKMGGNMMAEEKANQKEMFKVPMERIKQYAPKVKSADIQEFVLKACEYYQTLPQNLL